VLAGKSTSVAMAVKVKVASSAIDLFPIAPSTGATLTSLTVTVIVSQSLKAPSLTQTSKVYSSGPWASLGVQLKAPAAVIAAPSGTSPARLNTKV